MPSHLRTRHSQSLRLSSTCLQFLREELQYEAGYERRQRAFHHNDDMHISVRELWEAWLRSEVICLLTISSDTGRVRYVRMHDLYNSMQYKKSKYNI